MQTGYVYIMKDNREDIFKIGMTHLDVGVRLRSFKTASPDMKIVAVIEAEKYRQLEKFIHRELKDNRLSGEWFSGKNILSVVVDIIKNCDGMFGIKYMEFFRTK